MGVCGNSMVPRQEQSAVETPEHVSALLSELLRAGRQLQAGIDPS
jgi:hypothetical protein